jgi:TolB protein
MMIAADRVSVPYQIWRLSYPGGEAVRLSDNTDNIARMNITADSSAIIALLGRHMSNVWIMPVDDVSRARRITFGSGGYRGKLCWTRDGKIIFESVTASTPDISIMNEDGSGQHPLLSELAGRAASHSPAVSPDGRYIFYASDLKGARHIYRVNSDGSNPVQLTSGGGEDQLYCSPDGRSIVYANISTERPTIWKVAVDGGDPVQLTSAPAKLPIVSPDGKYIACAYIAEGTVWKLAILPIEGGEPVKVFPQPVDRIAAIKWSPDGRSIAYVDNNHDASNIWLQPVDGRPLTQLTRFDSDQVFGFEFSPDGKQLACIRGIWERNLVLVRNFK